jgi:hypothetical protein
VTIEAPCLDCGEPLRVVVRDGRIVAADPAGQYAFIDVPFREWRADRTYA